MTETTISNSRIGMLADDHVYEARRDKFPHRILLSDGYLFDPENPKKKTSFRAGWGSVSGLDDPYLAVLRFSLQSSVEEGFLIPIAPGYAQKPDLVDVDSREVWEVKPSGDTNGPAQLARYLSLLNQADREYLALSRHPRYLSQIPQAPVGSPRPWSPGGAFPIKNMVERIDGRRIEVRFRFDKPGVILWESM